MKRITKGLDLPITNSPEQKIYNGPAVKTVAVLGDDYVGMKPTMAVEEGEVVKRGQLLFTDKKSSGVKFTSPVAGKVVGVNRGAKRAFQSVVVEAAGDEAVQFEIAKNQDVTTLNRDDVVSALTESGLWVAFRTRPFSKVPDPESKPSSIFVTAIDTNPLAAKPSIVIGEREQDFTIGLQVLQALTDGQVYLSKFPGVSLPGMNLPGVTTVEFDGPHPAGLAGTHIHLLDPVSESKTVWHLNYQDVLAIGFLFVNGELDGSRVISLAGPAVTNPRLIRTTLGASLDEITAGELVDGDVRVISGSVLSGRAKSDVHAFLGRYHLQASALVEGREREFLGWQKPGMNKFSIKRVFASAFFGRDKKYDFTTSTEGSKRAMVPIGMYEKIMPLDILPTFLLRALITGDTEQATALGALELDEEDLALCTFVCPGKYEYGTILRENLDKIERDG
jgi:Na+-transporting NADH:ubiquinone oxidoreductase subunit A